MPSVDPPLHVSTATIQLGLLSPVGLLEAGNYDDDEQFTLIRAA